MAYFFTPDTPFYEEEGELAPIKSRRLQFKWKYRTSNQIGLKISDATIVRNQPSRFVERGFTGLKVLTPFEFDPTSNTTHAINTEYGGLHKEVSYSYETYDIVINDINKIPEKGLFFLGVAVSDGHGITNYNDHGNDFLYSQFKIFETDDFKKNTGIDEYNFVDIVDNSLFTRDWLFTHKTPNGNTGFSSVIKVNGINIFRSIDDIGYKQNKYIDRYQLKQPHTIEKFLVDNCMYSIENETYNDTNMGSVKSLFMYVGQNEDFVIVRSLMLKNISQDSVHPDNYVYNLADYVSVKQGPVIRTPNQRDYYNHSNLRSIGNAIYYLIPKRNTWKRNNNPTSGFDVPGAEYIPDLPIHIAINKTPSRYMNFLTAANTKAADLWVGDDLSLEQIERMINMCFFFLYNPRTDHFLEGYKSDDTKNKEERKKKQAYFYHSKDLENIRNTIIPLRVWDRDDIKTKNFIHGSDGYRYFQRNNILELPYTSLFREYLNPKLIDTRPKPISITGTSQDKDTRNFELISLKYSRDYKKINVQEILDIVKYVARGYSNILWCDWGMKATYTSGYNKTVLQSEAGFSDLFFMKTGTGNTGELKSIIDGDIASFGIRDVPNLEKNIKPGQEITPFTLYYMILSVSNLIYRRIKDYNWRYNVLPTATGADEDIMFGCHSSTSCHSSCHGNCHSSARSCHTVYLGSRYEYTGSGVPHRVDIMGAPGSTLLPGQGYYWDAAVARSHGATVNKPYYTEIVNGHLKRTSY